MPDIANRTSQRLDATANLHDNPYAERGLCQTLRVASAHPFYQTAWPRPYDEGEDPIEMFLSLPPLTKADLRNCIFPRLGTEDRYCVISHTTGTTGEIAFRYRSVGEIENINRILDLVPETQTTEQELVLSLTNPYHGSAFPVRGESIVFQGGIYDLTMLNQLLVLLKQHFSLAGVANRVSVINASISHLRVLTQYLIDTAVDVNEFDVSRINTYGGYVSRRARQVIREYWGVEPLDRFSVSEMLGGGNICSRCGAIQLDPHLVAQVYALNGSETMPVGSGLLALTELFPFGTTQPLVNYLTGDIVEWIMDGCTEHQGYLRYLGRVDNCLITNEPAEANLALSSVALYEALNRPDVEMNRRFEQLPLIDHRSVGHPLGGARLLSEAAGPVLEVRFRPRGHDANRTVAEISASLLKTTPWLRKKERAGKSALAVVPDPDWGVPLTLKEA